MVEKIRIQERSYQGITTNHKDIFAFVNLVNKVHHIPSYWLVIADRQVPIMRKDIVFRSLIKTFYILQILDFLKGPLAHDGDIHLPVKGIIACILYRTKLMQPVYPVLAVCQVAIHGDTAVKIYCHSCSYLSSSFAIVKAIVKKVMASAVRSSWRASQVRL